MAYKEPGKSPWEKNTPPNIEEFLQQLQEKFKLNFNLFNFWMLIPLVVLIWAATGIFIVEPDEMAVVRRFGKMGDPLGQGIHYRIPWPVDKVDLVKVAQIRSMELGFRSIQRGQPALSRAVPAESLMITGDENLVHLQVVVHYRISDIQAFLFKVWDPEGTPEGRTIRDVAETAIRGVAGSMKIDDILTIGRAKMQEDTKLHLQELMDRYNTGMLITEVKLQAVEPPEPVQSSFKDVVSAKEDRERIINEAKAYSEDILPKARGEAERMLRDAEGYREARVREAQGDSARFLSMLKEYREAKIITRRRMYLETMGEVLNRVEKVVISKEVGGKTLPYLPLTEVGGKGQSASQSKEGK